MNTLISAFGFMLNVLGCLSILGGCYLLSENNPLYYVAFAVGIVLIAIGYRMFYADEDFEDFEN